jgi:hypothetical protein
MTPEERAVYERFGRQVVTPEGSEWTFDPSLAPKWEIWGRYGFPDYGDRNAEFMPGDRGAIQEYRPSSIH